MLVNCSRIGLCNRHGAPCDHQSRQTQHPPYPRVVLYFVSSQCTFILLTRSTQHTHKKAHTVKGAVRSRLWLRAPTRILLSKWCAVFVSRPGPCCRLTSQHGAERHQMKQHCPFAQPPSTNLKFFHTSYKKFSLATCSGIDTKHGYSVCLSRHPRCHRGAVSYRRESVRRAPP